MAASYYIGTSGWHYPHWQAPFYPPDLAPAARLEYYARHFATVEINSSFYRLPSHAAARAWKMSTPTGFTFANKASRYIPHMKKLRAFKRVYVFFDNDEAGYAVCNALALRMLLEGRRA